MTDVPESESEAEAVPESGSESGPESVSPGGTDAGPARGAALIRQMGLLAVLREDLRTHRGEILRPGLQALWVYRIGTWAGTLPRSCGR